MQAFGQQGAQMLGVFGPIGAVLGAAVAIFSAVAVAAERSGKEVSNFGSVFGQLQEPLTATVDAVRGFAASFGNVMPFVVNNIDTAIIAGGILAAVFGVKMVAGMIASAGASTIMTAAMVQVRAAVLASAIATGRFNVALIAMRSAALLTGAAFKALGAILMRFLPIAVLIGVAKLVEMFLQLRRGAGSFGEALSLLKDVAIEVFDRIRLGFGMVPLAIKAGSASMSAFFLEKLADMSQSFVDFTGDVADGLNSLFNLNLTPLGGDMAAGMRQVADSAKTAADQAGADLKGVSDAVTAPLTSLNALREAFANGATEVSIFGAASEEALGETGRAAKDVKEKINDLRKSIEGSMESAFMSIIDGTKSVKDAFRSMASEIIKELYRVFVVQRLVGMISNAVGGFFNMNQVSGPAMPLGTGNIRPPVRPSFAGGGYTGMGSRSGGVDGRGGFPAILHPNETVVDHSAGQGMGTVVVNQTINISTGVQQTVRSEIKQLMPQIAESAKQAVVDAKRRGGSYGRAFA